MLISFFKKLKVLISKVFQKSFSINYIFFSFFFLSISFFSAFKTNTLFTFYSIFQASLLTIIFIFIHQILKPNYIKKIFIAFTFFTILFYTANFILLGLMNTNLLFAITLFTSGGLENFLILIKALNLNFTITLIIILLIIFTPFIGIATYNITNKICKKYPLKVPLKHLSTIFISSFLVLICFDLICKYKRFDYIFKNQHKLPLTLNFLPKKKQKFFFSNNLKPIRNEKKILEEINKKNIQIEDKPNIFIFVIETLRKDHITKEIAENIHFFKEQNISFDFSFSASNATQISWYSIFHSNHPIFWAKANKTLQYGSIPLNILKKAGYKINVITSAELSYFHMDRLLFGKGKHLIDDFKDLSQSSCNAAKRDKLAIQALNKKIKSIKNKNSNIFLVFLDSTHSEYSWPKNFDPKFLPIINKINYITLSQSKKNLELVKNRYKNAINYIDHLFKEFLSTLKNHDLYENSIIVLTGDHGEEFFEDGSLFHATYLHDFQIQVPIIYKLLKNNKIPTKNTTHIDIFPTILSEILPDENFNNYFDGKSIFSNEIPSYIITANQRGSLNPNELLIIKDKIKIHGKLINKNTLIFDIEDSKNISEENIEKELNNAFKTLIK